MVNGWVITKPRSLWHRLSEARESLPRSRLPANLQDDRPYVRALRSIAKVEAYWGEQDTLTFAKDKSPPVDGFWSITMHMVDGGWWFVPNPLNKFTVSPRNNFKTLLC